MISEIGCTNDGGVWIRLEIEVNKEVQTAILPMDAKKASEIHKSLGDAIKMGATWAITGKKPNVGNSTNTNKGSPPGDNGNGNGGDAD